MWLLPSDALSVDDLDCKDLIGISFLIGEMNLTVLTPPKSLGSQNNLHLVAWKGYYFAARRKLILLLFYHLWTNCCKLKTNNSDQMLEFE